MKKLLIKFIPIFLLTSIIYGTPAMAATDIYTAQKDDSLWQIAVKYKVGLRQIISANPQFNDPDVIYPGNKVYIPLTDSGALSLEKQVVALVNKERERAQVKPLTLSADAGNMARIKSEDMRDSKYFDHKSPAYGMPFEMLKSYEIEYTKVGENIANGQQTAEEVVETWLNSEEHKRNILDASFKEIGVGYAEGDDTTYWSQIFIG